MEDEIDIKIIEPKMGDVVAIHREYAANITRDTIKDYVEEPLVEACKILYDKNIRTLSSTANLGNQEEGIANIIIDFNSLSERNRGIAVDILNLVPKPKISHPDIPDIGMNVILEIPFKRESTVSEISQKAKEMARKFVKQKPTWIRGITLEEVEEEWRMGSGPELLAYMKERYYYDSENDLFYPNEEYYKKVMEASLEDTQIIKIPNKKKDDITVKVIDEE
jgi:hypothetical protein